MTTSTMNPRPPLEHAIAPWRLEARRDPGCFTLRDAGNLRIASLDVRRVKLSQPQLEGTLELLRIAPQLLFALDRLAGGLRLLLDQAERLPTNPLMLAQATQVRDQLQQLSLLTPQQDADMRSDQQQ